MKLRIYCVLCAAALLGFGAVVAQDGGKDEDSGNAQEPKPATEEQAKDEEAPLAGKLPKEMKRGEFKTPSGFGLGRDSDKKQVKIADGIDRKDLLAVMPLRGNRVDRRDMIPPIYSPTFAAVSDFGWLDDDDRILVVEVGGTVRGYPNRILTRHEIANDTIGNRYIGVVY